MLLPVTAGDGVSRCVDSCALQKDGSYQLCDTCTSYLNCRFGYDKLATQYSYIIIRPDGVGMNCMLSHLFRLCTFCFFFMYLLICLFAAREWHASCFISCSLLFCRMEFNVSFTPSTPVTYRTISFFWSLREMFFATLFILISVPLQIICKYPCFYGITYFSSIYVFVCSTHVLTP